MILAQGMRQLGWSLAKPFSTIILLAQFYSCYILLLLCRTFLLFVFRYIDPFLRKMRGYGKESESNNKRGRKCGVPFTDTKGFGFG
jgi:hypothetical protein